jgi:MFS family permease
MSSGESAVDADHSIDERLDAVGARQLSVSGGAKNGQDIVEMASPDGLDQSKLVREVLIQGADAHAGHAGHVVGREPLPTTLPQNVSRRLQDRLDGRAGTRLLRLFSHCTRPGSNASSRADLPCHNMSIVLVFTKHVEVPGRDAYRRRDLPTYLTARFLAEAAGLAQSVAIGWTVYQRSNAPLALGLVGLAQFVPMALLMLPAGELCDRLQPRRTLAAGLAFQALCAGAFLALTLRAGMPLWPLYPVLILSGAARALAEPASEALLPFLVPPERLPRAIAWSSSLWQLAVIAGPALGGLAYTLGAAGAYGFCCAAFLAAAVGAVMVSGRRMMPVDTSTIASRIARVAEGVRFVRSQPILLGSISLDLVAVLLGGATALLPVFARDILHVGPLGLGLLRSAPAVGACGIALWQVGRPPERSVGLKLLAAVAAFGVATIAFALSTSLGLSLLALIAVGATDMVSVNIRSSLMQLATPDELRGRVAAVNMLFVGTSSELGAFESGVLAALVGAVPAVLAGGCGAVMAAGFWLRLFPELRKAELPVKAAALGN